MHPLTDSALAIGQRFLKNNAKQPGIRTTFSGLQYRINTKAKDKKPKYDDRVRVHYRGTLVDGTEFDSSYQRGQPTEFAVNQVIAGWTEGLQLMSVGANWTFYIAAPLAYGEHSPSENIPANSTLIFDVELIDVL